jgi:hypothetical protein
VAEITNVSAAVELRAHRRTFESFGRLVLFAILDIGLTLVCLALAFLAHIPVVAMIAVFANTGNYGAER